MKDPWSKPILNLNISFCLSHSTLKGIFLIKQDELTLYNEDYQFIIRLWAILHVFAVFIALNAVPRQLQKLPHTEWKLSLYRLRNPTTIWDYSTYSWELISTIAQYVNKITTFFFIQKIYFHWNVCVFPIATTVRTSIYSSA